MQLLLALAGIWGFAAHMVWQLAGLDTEDPARCLMLFRSNRDAGLIPALFLAAAAVL
jgi:4-hydroxybenzoate polyprenyltransferase